MTIEKIFNGTELTVNLTGRIDTTTAPGLKEELFSSFEGIDRLILNFAELSYLSSAGLRILLMAQQTMNKQGEMIIRNVNETVKEIFELTGFCDVLTIE